MDVKKGYSRILLLKCEELQILFLVIFDLAVLFLGVSLTDIQISLYVRTYVQGYSSIIHSGKKWKK